jgi:hypothetical protein
MARVLHLMHLLEAINILGSVEKLENMAWKNFLKLNQLVVGTISFLSHFSVSD